MIWMNNVKKHSLIRLIQNYNLKTSKKTYLQNQTNHPTARAKNSTENKIVEEKADTKNIQVEFKDFRSKHCGAFELSSHPHVKNTNLSVSTTRALMEPFRTHA
jgi:hypothetical protein